MSGIAAPLADNPSISQTGSARAAPPCSVKSNGDAQRYPPPTASEVEPYLYDADT